MAHGHQREDAVSVVGWERGGLVLTKIGGLWRVYGFGRVAVGLTVHEAFRAFERSAVN